MWQGGVGGVGGLGRSLEQLITLLVHVGAMVRGSGPVVIFFSIS